MAARAVQTRTLDTHEAAYIAGLVDGEGTVTLTRKHRGENRQVCVSVSNTELVLLRYLYLRLGVGKITRKRTTAARHRPSYTYSVYNRQALELLRQITPWLMSYKRKRAELLLRDYVRLTPRNGKYSSQGLAERQKFEQRVLAIKPP